MNEIKRFYRVCREFNYQGLWYKPNGEFSGLIHNKYDFCKSSQLEMPYDPEIVGWLSTTDTLEDLYNWFPKDDILRLQGHGFFIYEYWADVYRPHQNHWVVCQDSSIRARCHFLD